MFKDYPGIEYRYVICDVCGKKFRVKDTVQVTDRYSTQNKMIVCKWDVDVLNPQIIPYQLPRDVFLTQKEFVRPEVLQESFVSTGNTPVQAGPPQNMTFEPDILSGGLMLSWEGPMPPGSGVVIGYRIYRTAPQGTPVGVYVSDTGTSAAYYLDMGVLVDTTYEYRVAAITDDYGVGQQSVSFYYPTLDILTETYIVTDDGSTITTDDGVFIIL